MESFETRGGECKSNASLTGFPFSPALWLWAAWSGHLALRVPRQLCHLLPQLPFAVCSQPSHRHRYHCHGDGLPGLPGGHQGKQVPPSQCKLDPRPQPLNSGSPCIWATVTGKAWEHQLTEPRRLLPGCSWPNHSPLPRYPCPSCPSHSLTGVHLMSFPDLSGFSQK